MHYHQMEQTEILVNFQVQLEQGLTHTEAQKRLLQVGPNELIETDLKNPWLILWEQLTAILQLILLAAAGLSIFLGDYKDAVAILAIVFLFALLGFQQEYRAEKSMAALRKLAVPLVRVCRQGQSMEISANALVPGDIVLLETGNMIPADCRILEAFHLKVLEATLTGESEAVEKVAEKLTEPELPLGDRFNMLYMGTVITYGRATALVVQTGMRTELGKIANLLQSVEPEATPLQKKLDELGKILGITAIVIALVLMIFGLIRGEELHLMLLSAVSLAVAIVPEGLPAVTTITLALGAQRMLKHQALVRKLTGIETLGSVTVICSDKTGTLTQNQMQAQLVALPQSAWNLAILDASKPVSNTKSGLLLLLTAGGLCNDAALVAESKGDEPMGIGDPTEIALLVMARAWGIQLDALKQSCPRLSEIPFDSGRKCMTTLHALNTTVSWPGALQSLQQQLLALELPLLAFIKGAPDVLLEKTTAIWTAQGLIPFGTQWQAAITATSEQLASEGMRVIGLAFRTLPKGISPAEIERDLNFIGLCALIDPPRPEVKAAVQTCLEAGIKPVMITGDHPLTALKIAKDLGIATQANLLTGQDLDQLSEADLQEKIRVSSVYARVAPEHKLKIVQMLQAQGHVVAMTGDGVNDAPALKMANIGVAMGLKGTDVAKEAATMILADDNFATIVAAIEQGRVIYDNIRKFIQFSMAGNLGKILVMLLTPFLGMPLALLPIQMLWLNLLTDGLLGLGLGLEQAERHVMQRPPASPQQSILGGGIAQQIAWTGVLIGVIAIAMGYGYWSQGNSHWQTVLFTTVVMTQTFQALALRSRQDLIWQVGFFSNPTLIAMIVMVWFMQFCVIYVPIFQSFFHTVALPSSCFWGIFASGSLVLWLSEGEKWWQQKRLKRRNGR